MLLYGDDNIQIDETKMPNYLFIKQRGETYLKNIIQRISSNNDIHTYILSHRIKIIEEENHMCKMVIKFMQKLLFRHKK